MNEQIQNALAPLMQFWAKTPGAVKKIAVGGIIISIISAISFSLLLNSENYVVIFDEISKREATEILAKLQDMDVKVRLDANDSIMVPEKDESRVRMALATEGYPKSGLSYYLIQENSGMLTTDYERKQYTNMQLQERIGASIKTLEGVKDAVVTITTPDEQVFYLEEKEEPSASVIIHMNPGNVLSDSQIAGIRNLIAKAVSGLSVDNIALSDSQGNDLGGSITKNDPDYTKLSITREIENDIKKKIIGVLVGPYSSNQFKVSVTATVDTDQLVTEETMYLPSETGENSGVISEKTTETQSSSNTQSDGGVAGTSSNSEVPTYPTVTGSDGSSSSMSSEYTKYQVSQTKSQSQKSGAKIENLSIAVAIDKVAFNPGEKESILQLVSFATGISEGSVTVQNFEFPSEEKETPGEIAPEEGFNKLIIYGAAGGLALLLILLTVVLLLRKKSKGKAKGYQGAAKKHKGQEEILDDIFGEVEQEEIKHIKPVQDIKREEIKQFTRENSEVVAQMIKTLLRTDND